MIDIITIDGPSGAGKSTVSRLLAGKLGYKYLDTGALYRAVAWKVREENTDIEDRKKIGDVLKKTKIVFDDDRVMVNGTDVTLQIRTPEIGELSSKISARPTVRKHLFAIQRQAGLKGKMVIEGRDIGTVIFPEAKNKFFLDAGIEERAGRRHRELKKNNPETTLKAVIEGVRKRDKRDSTRQSAPLRRTENMIYIDTGNLTVEEVVAKIMGALKSS